MVKLMSGLLPSESDSSPEQNGELQTLWLDSDDAGELLSCLSSETARAVLTALHEKPATASEVADRVDTSLQNARHHLGNLEEAGLVRVADTRYSSKGREMNVYAPAEEPMVVFVGREESGLVESLKKILPAVGVLAVASLLVQWLVTVSTGASAPGGLPRFSDGASVVDPLFVSIPPGALFFLGGLVALVALVAYRRLSPP